MTYYIRQPPPFNFHPKPGLPNGKAKCSCGLVAHVIFVERENPEESRYEAHDLNWQYRPTSNPENLPYGWYCGKEGHYEANYTELPVLPADLMSARAMRG